VGFEPTNGGFADLSLGPLGYRAELFSIAKRKMSVRRLDHTEAHPIGFSSFRHFDDIALSP
jgi:hypothetical protein